MSRGSKLIGPRTARVYAFHLLRLSVGRKWPYNVECMWLFYDVELQGTSMPDDTFRRNLVRQLTVTFTSRKRTCRKRSLPIGTAYPHLFHTLQKISGHVKVCALCSEKKKKLRQEGLKRQNINVSSVIFHCAVWGVFWNTTSSEMWRCKISLGYYMHTFITNKLKKELSFCLF